MSAAKRLAEALRAILADAEAGREVDVEQARALVVEAERLAWELRKAARARRAA